MSNYFSTIDSYGYYYQTKFTQKQTFLTNFTDIELDVEMVFVKIYNLYFPNDYAWIEAEAYDCNGCLVDYCNSFHSRSGNFDKMYNLWRRFKYGEQLTLNFPKPISFKKYKENLIFNKISCIFTK